MSKSVESPADGRANGRVDTREVDTGTGQLRCHVEDRVGVVTLNRPEARNALSVELKEALQDVIPRLDADPEVGCLLLTGAGTAFCSGGDTKVMAKGGRPPSMEDRQRLLRWEHRLPRMLHELGKPVIAALPGAAAGAGLSRALARDLPTAAGADFSRVGFVAKPREKAPAAVRESWEFKTGCPSTAVLMKRSV